VELTQKLSDMSMESPSSFDLDKQRMINDLFVHEMGFSLIVEMLIEAKKPIVGHNMMFDIIYLYNQFVDELPATYLEFATKWYALFPSVYDNKVLSSASE
jgi:CAF1 family ribonuclease